MYKNTSLFYNRLMSRSFKQFLNRYRLLNIFVVLAMLIPASVEAKAASNITNTYAGRSAEVAIAIQPKILPNYSPEDATPPQTSQLEVSLTSEAVTSPANPYSSSTDTWRVQIGVPGYIVSDIAMDTIGGIYLTGRDYNADGGFVAKLDSTGAIQWNFTFPGTGMGTISVDNTGNIYVAGGFDDPITGHEDVYVAKLNNEGAIQWESNFGDPAKDESAFDVTVGPFGQVYVTGEGYRSPEDYINDAFVASVAPETGELVWTTYVGENILSWGNAIDTDANGNIYIVGTIRHGQESPYDYNAFVAGLDYTGVQSYFTVVGDASDYEDGFDIAVSDFGEVFIVGSDQQTINGEWSMNAYVARLDPYGRPQWNIPFGGPFTNATRIVLAGTDLYLSGRSDAIWGCPSEAVGESFIAKFSSSDGAMQWNTFREEGDSRRNRISGLATNGNGTVYIASFTGEWWEGPLSFATQIDVSSLGPALSPIAQAVLNKTLQTSSQTCGGNHYEGLITLPPGQAAFERFGELAATAQHEVDFVTMGWDQDKAPNDEDSPGDFFLAGVQRLFIDVQQHPENYPGGVQVRILLGLKKYNGSKDQRLNVINDLIQLNIPRNAPELNWKVDVATYRNDSTSSGKHSHVKMVIVDGQHVIVSGYNMHYNYLEENPVHDMGVEISGPIAFEALDVYDGLWLGAHRCDNDSCTQDSVVSTISHDLSVLTPPVTGNDVVFSLFRDDLNKTADNAIQTAIEAANSEVNIIQNRFYNVSEAVPLQYVTGILNAIDNENVHVNLLVSSGAGDFIGTFDLFTNVNGVCNLRDQILARNPANLSHLNVRYSKYANPIHTKALSIDDSFVIVGSQNFDPSAWGDNNISFGDLAEYSLGIDNTQAASAFQEKFTSEWNAAGSIDCLSLKDRIFATTLQDSIDQALPGTAILIPEGVYSGSVTINKPLALIGAGANQTIIQPEGNQPVFRVTSSDVTIINMKIKGGAGYGIELIDSSPHSLRNIQINRVVFENNAQGGILAQGQIAGSPMNYSIENSTFIGGADGITVNMLETQADTSIVRDNIFSGQSVAPVHILSSDDSRVEYSYNLFDDCNGGSCTTNWHVGNLSSVSSEHDNLFDLDPLFADPSNGVYQLSAGSPAIDAGDPTLLHDFLYDGNNDDTVQIDIGAFEYVPVANTAPVVNAGNDQIVNFEDGVVVNATYSDADNTESHSARIDWGDGTVEDVAVTMTGPGAGEVAGEHTYSAGGTYTVEICVADLYGAVGCDTVNVEVIAPPGMTTVAAGSRHTCSLSSAGAVYCWGYNYSGQLGDGSTTITRYTPVSVHGLSSGVVAIAAGEEHTCVLTSSGGVKCWGENSSGQLGDGTTTDRNTPVNVSGLTSGVAAIAAGNDHTCAVTTAGGVKCWGENANGQLGNGSRTDRTTPVNVSGLTSGVASIGAGNSHTCAVTVSGGAKCWGSNSYGQLGDGTNTERTRPVNVSGLTSGVAKISGGGYFTCAVTTSGGGKCWGENYQGQLGDGTTTSRKTPVDVSGLTSGVAAVATGDSHTCALTTGGGVKCWGQNWVGELGDGTFVNRRVPVDVMGLESGITAITAGSGSFSHTCAVTTNGYVRCWGYNTSGQLGAGDTGRYMVPMDTHGLNNAVAIETGTYHTCALTTSGGAKCWGENSFGQLGNGTTTDSVVPAADVSDLTSGVTVISAGGNSSWAHTCAIVNGGVKCWGNNSKGQLGDGTTTNRNTPVDVSGLTSGVAQIAAGGFHTCALTTSGGVKCWGYNSNGQLGDGTTTQHTTPVDVSGLTSGVVAISAGENHTCALTSSGDIKCWGANSAGQLGDGTTTQQLAPVDVVGLASGVTTISVGATHTCALTAEGGMKCWGNNSWGKLGDGTLTDRNIPVNVNGLTSGVTAIAAGGSQTCALMVGGGMKCWGGNIMGEVGDGTNTYRTSPVDVSGLTGGVIAISAGQGGAWSHTCALMSSGTVKCWGYNTSGQIGNGTGAHNPMPLNTIFTP